MKSWYEFYENRVNESYSHYIAMQYFPFIEAIPVEKGDSLLEVGCGIASITKLLAERNPNSTFLATDADVAMINLSYLNTRHLNNVFLGICLAEKVSGNYTCVHSHGLLEHFKDDAIIKIVNNLRRISDIQVHYVPLIGHRKPSFGDERLYEKNYWEDLLDPSESFTFNEGKDLCFTIKEKRA
jgi:cyclopropane fatty-acyl-phospholipid synthase-like methyltransferase